MAFDRVRSAEDRLADSTWHRGERVGFWLTVATLGCFTFAWFGIHALRQFHTARRSVDESWAVVWGVVAGVSMSVGGGLDFSTDAAAAISMLVWTVRLGSVFHVYVDHTARMRDLADREVERERSMIASVLGGHGGPGGPASQGRPGPAVGGRFEVPASDPFAAGRPTTPAPAPAAPTPPVRGRSWGRLGHGAPAPDSGRRLESPAPPPGPRATAGAPADGTPDAPVWVPGLEPLEPRDAVRGRRDGRGDPAAPPSGRVLDL